MSVHYEGEVVKHLTKAIDESARETLLDMIDANSDAPVVAGEAKRRRITQEKSALPMVGDLSEVPNPKTTMGEKFDRLAQINHEIRTHQDKVTEIKNCASALDTDLDAREEEEKGNTDVLMNLHILRQRIKSKTAEKVQQLEELIRKAVITRRQLEIAYWNDFYDPSEPIKVEKKIRKQDITNSKKQGTENSNHQATAAQQVASFETSSQQSSSSKASAQNSLKPEELLLAAHGGKKDTIKALEEALCDVQYRNPLEIPPCNCRKSKCLKLYCECFALGVYCKDCRCIDCLNTSEAEPRRAHAVTAVLNRRPNAIRCKKLIKNPESEGPKTELAIKGCHCKKTKCLKKYCVCYHGGIKCGPHCVCVDCHNKESSNDDLPELRPAEAELSNVLASMSKA